MPGTDGVESDRTGGKTGCLDPLANLTNERDRSHPPPPVGQWVGTLQQWFLNWILVATESKPIKARVGARTRP